MRSMLALSLAALTGLAPCQPLLAAVIGEVRVGEAGSVLPASPLPGVRIELGTAGSEPTLGPGLTPSASFAPEAPKPNGEASPKAELSEISARLPEVEKDRSGEKSAEAAGAPFHGARVRQGQAPSVDGGASSPELAPLQPPSGETLSRCPFQRLLQGQKAWPAAAMPGRFLRFSVLELARGAFKTAWDFLRGREPFSGEVKPKRMSFLWLMGKAYTHTKEVTKVLEAVHGKHGDLAYATAPWGDRYLFVSDPNAAREILKETDKNETAGPSAFEKNEIQIGGLAQLTGRGTVFLGKGEDWRSRKDLMQPYFTPKASQGPLAHAEISGVVERALMGLHRAAAARGPPGLEVSAMREMNAVTMNVILKVLFGVERSPAFIAAEISPAFEAVKKLFTWETANPTIYSLAHLPGLTGKKSGLKTAYEALERFADEIIAERRTAGGEGTLLDALLSSGMSHEQIRREVLTLVLAGHETTASTVTWALVELARNPAALERLRREVGREAPSAEALKAMPFLNQVVDETLRLHTPAYLIFRKAARDTTVQTAGGKLTVPAGTHIVLSTYMTHRREVQWGEAKTGYAADGFHPERLDPENLKTRGLDAQDLRTYPFGWGPRICMGRHLSIHETKLILARFLQLFDYSYTGTCPYGGKTAVANLSTQPADGYPVRLTPRRLKTLDD